MKFRTKPLIVILAFFLFTLPAHATELSDLIEKANTAFHADDYKTAVELYTQALEINPTDYMAWLNLGFSLVELERYDESLKCYKKAKGLGAPFTKITYSNNDAIEWNIEGDKYQYHYSNPEKAIECYLKALEADPSDAGICNAIAVSYKKLGNLKKAEEYFKKAIKVNPLFENPYVFLGDLFYEQITEIGSPKKVIHYFSIASKVIDPNSEYVSSDLEKIKECKELLEKQQ